MDAAPAEIPVSDAWTITLWLSGKAHIFELELPVEFYKALRNIEGAVRGRRVVSPENAT